MTITENELKQAETAEPALFKPSARFKVACRMLREAGHLDVPLPGQRRGESALDWLVRLGLAPDARTAVEMLILGRGLMPVLDELTGSTFKQPAVQ